MAQYDSDTIRQASDRCLRLFAQVMKNIASLDGLHEQTHNIVQDEFVRFKLWESNIGVFANVHASLDFRLREIPDVAEHFLRQLDTIEARLHQVSQTNLCLGLEHEHEAESSQLERPHQCPECERAFPSVPDMRKHLETLHSVYHTGDEKDQAHEADSASSFGKWSTSELMQSIHESIDWLHRLSNMVRKASFNSQNKRADDFMLRDESGEKSDFLTQALLEGLTQLYRFYLKTYAAGVGDQLAERLVQTMVIRHKRILYRRSRRKVWNLDQIKYSPEKVEQESHHSRDWLPNSETIASSDGKTAVLPQPTAKPKTTGSQATATTIDINAFRKAFAQSEVSKATSNSLMVSDRVLLPPRPAAAKSGTEFVCDYCGLLLHARQASNAAVWAKHVRKDLDPYVCVFDECDTPLEIYSSSKEWLAHMRSRHRMRWHCFATSHEPSFFQSPEALERHLRETHPSHFSDEEISFLVENSNHPSLSVIEDCPFCQQVDANTEEHVARHLIQLALQSLPWPDDCYSSFHPSQSSRGADSEGTASSIETFRDDDGMLEFRATDWNAWEKEIGAGHELSFKSQWNDALPQALTDEGHGAVGLYDIISPNYDAAKDEVLENFRRRANFDAAKDRPAETGLSERQKSLRKFVQEEAAFVQDLYVLTNIYKGASNACSKLDQITTDRLFRNVDQLTALHWKFLDDLRKTVPFSREPTALSPVSRDSKASFLRTAPELIGVVILQNLRRLGPPHKEYYRTREDAISLWKSIRKDPTIQDWTNECKKASSDLTVHKFDDLIELPNTRYQSDYYTKWSLELLKQTPDNHPDKSLLPAAERYHRASVFCAVPNEQGTLLAAINESVYHSTPAQPETKKLWSAVALYGFNLETNKQEAGQAYLMYQAGEVFDILAEDGEFWLATTKGDVHSLVGWIWSKHLEQC